MNRITTLIQKHFYGSPIKKNLGFVVILLFLVPVILISFWIIFFLYKNMITIEIQRVEQSFSLTEKTLSDTFNEVHNFSDRLYVNKQLQNIVSKNYSSAQEVLSDYGSLSFLDGYLQTYRDISGFKIYSDNHTLLDNQFIVKSTQDIKIKDWYKRAIVLKGKSFWCFITDPVSKKDYLSLVRSVWNSNQTTLIGVLVIHLNQDTVNSLLLNQVFESSIIHENKIIFSSQNYDAEMNSQILDLCKNDEDVGELLKFKFGKERKALIYHDFSPDRNDSVKLKIAYIFSLNILNQATNKVIVFSIIIILAALIFAVGVIFIFSRYISIRVKKVQKGISQVVSNNFNIESTIGGNDEFEEIYKYIYEMSGNIKNLIETVYQQNLEKERIAARQSEISFKMLSTQINPHFLFNTLETIRMKALSSGEKDVAYMLKLLASLLRYNLSVKGQPVPLLKEIEAVQNYLTIQHMRFGERISYDVDTLCNIQEIKILPLLIQPLVENSFSHGLEDKVAGGFIYILIKMENSELIIEVQDNGCGIDEEKLQELEKSFEDNNSESSNSIGLANVNSRIKLYYGNEYGIKIESYPGEGTKVKIRIPCL